MLEKKSLKGIMCFIINAIFVFAVVLVPVLRLEAASFPVLKAKESVYNGTIGKSNTACEYEVTICTHKYEKVVINVYNSSGTMVLESPKSYYWLNSELSAGSKNDSLTFILDVPSDSPVETYTIVAKFQYSDDGAVYEDAPNPQTTTFVVKAESDSSSDESSEKYSNEWVDGKWYNSDGTQTYKGTMSWKKNSTGWWIEDSAGWYPTSKWQKIDGKWYYFTADGYMDYSEYRDGYWLGSDGAWIESYSGGKWSVDGTGWWYSDSSGWYPANQWLWIDGTNYHFNAKGYCTNP